MKKFFILGGILSFVCTVAIVCCFVFINKDKIHEQIDIEKVDSITVWGINTSQIVNEKEKGDIIKWFNLITDIRENKGSGGITPEKGIIIKLKSGKNILILKSGEDFEIQKTNSSGTCISYWGRQINIHNILER